MSPKYISLLNFVSTLDKAHKQINCLSSNSANYIVSLFDLLNIFARKTKTDTITNIDELMFGKVNSKKVLVVGIIFDKKTGKKDINKFMELLNSMDYEIVSYNEKIKKITFHIFKKEFLHVTLS